MRFVITFFDNNNERQYRFAKSLDDARAIVANLRKTRRGQVYNFEIKVIKPY